MSVPSSELFEPTAPNFLVNKYDPVIGIELRMERTVKKAVQTIASLAMKDR